MRCGAAFGMEGTGCVVGSGDSVRRIDYLRVLRLIIMLMMLEGRTIEECWC